MHGLTWVEVSRSALAHNMGLFRNLAGESLLAPVVKSNAYGHGLLQVAGVAVQHGADWLCVNALYEAVALREAGFTCPIHILGYVSAADAETVVNLNLRMVVYNSEIVRTLSQIAAAKGAEVPLHIKLETGNNRQGLQPSEALELARLIHSLPGARLEGISSHYADIEDTTDHAFARSQLRRFLEVDTALKQAGIPARIRSFSNSAATILWPETRFELVRLGVSLYGLWPSKETFVSAIMLGRETLALQPAATWKTVIAQVKRVPRGEFVGYGRTFRTSHDSRLAVLPIGYYDGYARGLSNLAHVLVGGSIAPVRGRVAMNMTVVDVTDVPEAGVDSEVVLLGRQGDNVITAEQLADWAHTINYEIPTRINDRIPRVMVDG